MEVSIIIPVYKVEPYIKQCLLSIIEQTFTDYEVILIDDASPDQSISIATTLLTQHQINYQLIVHPKNRGLSAARNSGIKAAKGKYTLFVDSDDQLTDAGVLHSFYQTAQEGDYQVVAARVNLFIQNEKQEYYHRFLTQKCQLNSIQAIHLWLWHYITDEAWNKFIQTDFLRKNKLFFLNGYYYEDFPWTLALLHHAERICLLPRANYNYYHHQTETITNTITKKKINHVATHIQHIITQIDSNPTLKQQIPPQAMARFTVHKINYILFRKEIIESPKLWRYAYRRFKRVYQQSYFKKEIKKYYLPTFIAHCIFLLPLYPKFQTECIEDPKLWRDTYRRFKYVYQQSYFKKVINKYYLPTFIPHCIFLLPLYQEFQINDEDEAEHYLQTLVKKHFPLNFEYFTELYF